MTQPMTDERLAEIRTALSISEDSSAFYGIQYFACLSDLRELLARLDAAEELIREVADSADDDDGIPPQRSWTRIQISRDTLGKCRSYLR